jgi:hypothetical protein
MEGMEDKLGAILGNPELMQKIMGMAQSLQSPDPGPTAAPPPAPEGLPLPDPAMLQTIGSFMSKSGIDGHQKALLGALSPYLSQMRIRKLENAMRAAKMAGLAASLLKNSGLNPGR